IARYKKLLTPELLKTGDASAGRALFAKTCMQCHTLYGEGGKVGPDLTGSNRQDLDYLLVNIVDPSAVIAKDYMVSIIYMDQADVSFHPPSSIFHSRLFSSPCSPCPSWFNLPPRNRRRSPSASTPTACGIAGPISASAPAATCVPPTTVAAATKGLTRRTSST